MNNYKKSLNLLRRSVYVTKGAYSLCLSLVPEYGIRRSLRLSVVKSQGALDGERSV